MPWFDGVDEIGKILRINGGIFIDFWSSDRHFCLIAKTDGTASLEQLNDWDDRWEIVHSGDISDVLERLEYKSQIERGNARIFVKVCEAWLDGYSSATQEFLNKFDEFRKNLRSDYIGKV